MTRQRKPRCPYKYGWDSFQIGEERIYPNARNNNTVRGSARLYGRAHGMRFRTAYLDGKTIVRRVA